MHHSSVINTRQYRDPELAAAFSNPKLMSAMQDIMSNPANISKYRDDPEIMALLQKMAGTMGGMGGMGGGMPDMGGMGGMGDGGGASGAAAHDPFSHSGATVEEID